MKALEPEAKRMATTVNGGDWDKNYTDAQKSGWCLKVRWAMQQYCPEDYNNHYSQYEKDES